MIKDYTTATGDIAIFWHMQKLFGDDATKFNNLKNAFEDDKKKYNDKHAERETQKTEDPLGLAEKVLIPVRPERPWLWGSSYQGSGTDLGKYVGSGAHAWKAKASENKGYSALVTK